MPGPGLEREGRLLGHLFPRRSGVFRERRSGHNILLTAAARSEQGAGWGVSEEGKVLWDWLGRWAFTVQVREAQGSDLTGDPQETARVWSAETGPKQGVMTQEAGRGGLRCRGRQLGSSNCAQTAGSGLWVPV